MNDERTGILVVEGSSVALTEIAAQLLAKGHRVATCPLGAVAMEYVAAHRPALALLDASIFYLGGAQPIEALRAQWPGTRIVCLDADGPWALFLEIPAHDSDGLLIHPCVSSEVLGYVERLVPKGTKVPAAQAVAGAPGAR